jgi:hypothetical protein
MTRPCKVPATSPCKTPQPESDTGPPRRQTNTKEKSQVTISQCVAQAAGKNKKRGKSQAVYSSTWPPNPMPWGGRKPPVLRPLTGSLSSVLSSSTPRTFPILRRAFCAFLPPGGKNSSSRITHPMQPCPPSPIWVPGGTTRSQHPPSWDSIDSTTVHPSAVASV